MEVAHAQVANDRKQNINLGSLHHVHKVYPELKLPFDE